MMTAHSLLLLLLLLSTDDDDDVERTNCNSSFTANDACQSIKVTSVSTSSQLKYAEADLVKFGRTKSTPKGAFTSQRTSNSSTTFSSS